MRKIATLFVFATFGYVVSCDAQSPTFTFDCFCGTLLPVDTTCDICNTTTQSRYFKGLLIRKNGVAFKWIEEPYTVIQNFNALTFRELIPNAEQIRIDLVGTQWTTIEGFRDSVQCPCAGQNTLTAGPGIHIYNDTIASIPQQIDTFDRVGDTLRVSLTRDSVPYKFLLLPSGAVQTLNSTGDPTSHTATLSGGGGSVKIKEGANIALTTDATGLNGEVTISAVLPTDLNGIYGDGVTPGSGSDTLPPGGSTVTIPGPWQPLNFFINSAPGVIATALQVTVDDCDDTQFTKYLVGKSPTDSLEIYNFACAAVIKETGGSISIETDREAYLTSGNETYIIADSVYVATVPTRPSAAFVLGQASNSFVHKLAGTTPGHVLRWSGSEWAPNGINMYDLVTASQAVDVQFNQVLVDTLTVGITLNLPACNAANDGVRLEVIKGGPDTFEVNIEPAGSEEFVDGSTTKSIYNQGTVFTCTCQYGGAVGRWFYISM